MTALTVTKTLKKAWKVGGAEAREVELREATVDDLVAAEQEANPGLSPNAFNRALLCQVIVRAGDFTGPFAAGHFKGMPADTFATLREGMQEAAALGEG